MTIKANLLITPLFLALAVLLTGCPNVCTEDVMPRYHFDVTASFTPDVDSVQVGDTIFFLSEFSSTLTPQGGTTPVEYTNGQLSGAIYFHEYPAGQQRRFAANDFLYITSKGESSENGEVGRQFIFEETASLYKVKLGIVPKRKGRYALFIVGVNDVNRCDGASFNINLTNDQQSNKKMADAWAGGPAFTNFEVYAVTVY